MVVTLEILSDIYSKPDKEGKQKILKKNVISKKQFETTFILAEHYLNDKGIASKKYCTIKYGDDYFRANHKFEEIEKLTKQVVFKGFNINGEKK